MTQTDVRTYDKNPITRDPWDLPKKDKSTFRRGIQSNMGLQSARNRNLERLITITHAIMFEITIRTPITFLICVFSKKTKRYFRNRIKNYMKVTYCDPQTTKMKNHIPGLPVEPEVALESDSKIQYRPHLGNTCAKGYSHRSGSF